MTKRTLTLAAITAVMAAMLAVTAGGIGAAGATATNAKGRFDSGTAYYAIVRQDKHYSYLAGEGRDKVLGQVASTYVIAIGTRNKKIRVTAKKVVLYSGRGSLVGTATADVVTGMKTQTVTNGKLRLTKGFGSLKGHTLIGTFHGTADLASNVIVFHYRATFK